MQFTFVGFFFFSERTSPKELNGMFEMRFSQYLLSVVISYYYYHYYYVI